MANSYVTIPTDSPYFERRWLGLVFVGISVIVISLDNTIVNVALPSIARELNASTTDLQWMVDGYVLVFAALLLTMGTLGDRIGRKRALQTGLVLFGVGSLAAAVAPNIGVLTGARAFLGLAGALMLPATLSTISATFPPVERPQAIASWASLFGLGVGIGPVLGGFLVQNFGWHSVFLVNIPVIAVAVIGGQIYLGETKEPNAPPPDLVGSVLSIIGLVALVYGIIEAGVVGWTEPTVVLALVAAVIILALFAVWESRIANPMLPLHFFRNPAFTGANVTLTLLTFGLFGAVFFIPQFLQSVIGYPAFLAGIMIVPLAASLTVASNQSARITNRLGTKRTVVLGILARRNVVPLSVDHLQHQHDLFPVGLAGADLSSGRHWAGDQSRHHRHYELHPGDESGRRQRHERHHASARRRVGDRRARRGRHDHLPQRGRAAGEQSHAGSLRGSVGGFADRHQPAYPVADGSRAGRSGRAHGEDRLHGRHEARLLRRLTGDVPLGRVRVVRPAGCDQTRPARRRARIPLHRTHRLNRLSPLSFRSGAGGEVAFLSSPSCA